MSDHADTVREALHALATLAGNFEAAPNRVPRLINEQVATIGLSLDALVAERDEARLENSRLIAHTVAPAMRDLAARAEAAEAEVARLQHFIDCADTPLMRDVLAERDAMKAAWDTAADDRDDAHAEVARLREALQEIAAPDKSQQWRLPSAVAHAALTQAAEACVKGER